MLFIKQTPIYTNEYFQRHNYNTRNKTENYNYTPESKCLHTYKHNVKNQNLRLIKENI